MSTLAEIEAALPELSTEEMRVLEDRLRQLRAARAESESHPTVAKGAKTGAEIAALMAGKRPRLSAREAKAFEADLLAARSAMPPLVSSWD